MEVGLHGLELSPECQREISLSHKGASKAGGSARSLFCRCAVAATLSVALLAMLVVGWSKHSVDAAAAAASRELQASQNFMALQPVQLPTNQSAWHMHLGGFCLGKSVVEGETVGVIEVALVKKSPGPWPAKGEFTVLSFDDEANHWGKLVETWNSSSRVDKIQLASNFKVLDLELIGPLDNRTTIGVRFGITEHFYHHWHTVLLAYGVEDPQHVQIEAEHRGFQALSKFEAGDLQPKACPHDHSRDVTAWVYSHLSWVGL